MFRGSALARLDEKGRLKVPSAYRQVLKDRDWGTEFFVTSLRGECVRLYPLPIWKEIEDKLQDQSSFNPYTEKLTRATMYFGANASMDGQGRLLIPTGLRERAGLVEEVCILGQFRFLGIWNRQRLEDYFASNELTDEDLKHLSSTGF